MKNKKMIVVPALLLSASCKPIMSTPAPQSGIPFEALIRQVKHDVGTYVVQHQNDTVSEVATENQPCPGQVAFAIASVKMNVTTTFDRKGSANAGLKVPIDIVTIGASGKMTKEIGNSVSTSLTVYPMSAGASAEVEPSAVFEKMTVAPEQPRLFEGTPITDALNQLRADLIKTSDTPPCFNFGTGEQKENIVKWGFTVKRSKEVGGKVELLIFSLGADSSEVTGVANTIEVRFIATGEGFG